MLPVGWRSAGRTFEHRSTGLILKSWPDSSDSRTPQSEPAQERPKRPGCYGLFCHEVPVPVSLYTNGFT